MSVSAVHGGDTGVAVEAGGVFVWSIVVGGLCAGHPDIARKRGGSWATHAGAELYL